MIYWLVVLLSILLKKWTLNNWNCSNNLFSAMTENIKNFNIPLWTSLLQYHPLKGVFPVNPLPDLNEIHSLLEHSSVSLRGTSNLYSWPQESITTLALVEPDWDPTASMALTTSIPSTTDPNTQLTKKEIEKQKVQVSVSERWCTFVQIHLLLAIQPGGFSSAEEKLSREWWRSSKYVDLMVRMNRTMTTYLASVSVWSSIGHW